MSRYFNGKLPLLHHVTGFRQYRPVCRVQPPHIYIYIYIYIYIIRLTKLDSAGALKHGPRTVALFQSNQMFGLPDPFMIYVPVNNYN